MIMEWLSECLRRPWNGKKKVEKLKSKKGVAYCDYLMSYEHKTLTKVMQSHEDNVFFFSVKHENFAKLQQA